MERTTYEALLVALQDNRVDAFHSILKKDGLPKVDGYDYQLLLKAFEVYNKPIVKLLLDYGCSVNDLDTCVILLHQILIVKKISWYDIFETILERGTGVTKIIDNGNTVLHLAFYNQVSNVMIELLLNRFLKEITADLVNNDGLGCIHIACAKGSVDSIKQYLAISDVNAQVSYLSNSSFAGYSPLHFAVINDRLDVADFLCQNNANLYAQDRLGSTPIHLALESCNTRMLDVLFTYDKKHENYVNTNGLTHFMAACAADDPSIAEEYLRISDEHSVTSSINMMTSEVLDLNQHLLSGCTPIIIAAQFCRLKTFHTLLQRGAYCKQTRLFPINVSCDMRRGLMFSLIRHHYNVCPICKEMSFIYKRLACSNRGIRYLAGIPRHNCTSRNCTIAATTFFIFIGIAIIILIIGACTQDSSKSTIYEKTSFPEIKMPEIPKITYNPSFNG